MSVTSIEWTDATWNPTRGCTRVSEGCRNCYAERVAARFSRGNGFPHSGALPGPFFGFAQMTPHGPRWTGKVELIPEKLDEPLRWRKPRRVFVNSMSDLFHEDLPLGDIDRVARVMAQAGQHTFQVLTKRPRRMLDWAIRHYGMAGGRTGRQARAYPNLWLGVSVEDQATADERIPLLLQTPAAVRFTSYEPALAQVNFTRLPGQGEERYINALIGEHGWTMQHLAVPPERTNRLGWVIVGGESGPGARPFDVAWARSVVQQCSVAGVPAFVKQLGTHPCFRPEDEEARGNIMPSFHHSHGDLFCKKLDDPKGGDPVEWPEDLRVREFPA